MDTVDSTQTPSSLTTVPGSNRRHAELIALSLLSFPDSSPISVTSSFERVLDKAFASVSGDAFVQGRLVDRTLELASLLLDSTKRCFRKQASLHNSNTWLLPPELTVKVFSMLDTKSLMKAAVCCTMFNTCAMNRLCYSHIDLTTSAKFADEEVVSTMIHRAGKELRSLKLGRVVLPTGLNFFEYLPSEFCLQPLAHNHGFSGSHLRSLQLYNINVKTFKTLGDVLSVCPNITDLSIVGLCLPFESLFRVLTLKCRLIEHLFLGSHVQPGNVSPGAGTSLVELVTNCLNLTSLTLIPFVLTDAVARSLAENPHKLTYLNLSRSPTLKRRFLRDLALSCKASPLKTLILRNCPQLQKRRVLEFCNSLLTGNCKSIQHIDVSSNLGLASGRGKKCTKPKLPLVRLKEERSDLTFVAEFPMTSPAKCYRVCDEEDMRLIEIMEAEEEDEEEEEDPWDEDEDV